MLLSISINANASIGNDDLTFHVNSDVNETNHVIPVETLQALFPDVPLGEDGYVEGCAQKSNQKLKLDSLQVVETYTTEYNNGPCHLNIYSNGAYGVYGSEEIGASTRGLGHITTPSFIKSYYEIFPYGCGFSYTYVVYATSVTYYSQITNLSNTSPQVGLPNAYFEAESSYYVRSTQNASSPAKVYGLSNFYEAGYFCGTFKLTTKVNSGQITVTLVVI